MEIFRISREKYSTSLTASGASARWNRDNEFVLYTGEVRSLSALELAVHGIPNIAISFKTMVISVPDDDKLFNKVRIEDLPDNWRDTDAYPNLQEIGSNWYSAQRSLILQVPSVIIPQEYNFIINTTHPNFNDLVQLTRTEDFFWDNRL